MSIIQRYKKTNEINLAQVFFDKLIFTIVSIFTKKAVSSLKIKNRTNLTFQFKIQIKNIEEPKVWRRITVPQEFTFYQLHQVIQCAFDWEDCHLFKFNDKQYKPTLRISLEEDDNFSFLTFFNPPLDADTTRLDEIFSLDRKKLLYIYDFGDEWCHDIKLEKILPDKQDYAICTTGKGACPPEDWGGDWGYMNMKYILLNHPRSQKIKGMTGARKR